MVQPSKDKDNWRLDTHLIALYTISLLALLIAIFAYLGIH